MSFLIVIFKCSSLCRVFEHGKQWKLLEASAWFDFHCRVSRRFESRINAALPRDCTWDTIAMRWRYADDTIHRPHTMNAIRLMRYSPCSCSVKEKYNLSTHESKPILRFEICYIIFSDKLCYLTDSTLSWYFVTLEHSFTPSLKTSVCPITHNWVFPKQDLQV
jgi:hypothetical protein